MKNKLTKEPNAFVYYYGDKATSITPKEGMHAEAIKFLKDNSKLDKGKIPKLAMQSGIFVEKELPSFFARVEDGVMVCIKFGNEKVKLPKKPTRRRRKPGPRT